MDETDCGKVAIAVTEMTTNIVKTRETPGRVLWETIEHHGKPGLRIISLDPRPWHRRHIVSTARRLLDVRNVGQWSGCGPSPRHKI